MEKVLLIQVPYLQQEHVFPLGLAYTASFIRQHGYEVTIYDINLRRDNEREVICRLAEYDFDHVGISALSNRFSYVEWLAEEIKKIRDVPVTLGNGLGTGSYRVVLENIPDVDFCVLGEGEETYLDVLQNHSNPETIAGIAYRNDRGDVVVNPKRNCSIQIDELPWPAYDLFDMNKYFVESADFLDTGYFTVRGCDKYRRKMAYMITARGCPYKCKFCGKIIQSVRLRDVSDVIKEVKYLRETYGVTGITFYDELLTINKQRTLELADALQKMDILWSCQGRVNLVDVEFLKELKRNGCVSLGYGIESGSETILRAMDKRISAEQIIEAMKAAQEANLEIKIQLIFGYPGESKQTIRDTVKLFKALKSPGRRFNIIRPLPGSRLYDELIEHDVIDDELQYIRNLETALDMNIPIINLTDFKNHDIKLMACRTEGIMLLNYLVYMFFNHPIELLNKFRRSKGSVKIVCWYLAKLVLSYFRPLFYFLARDRYPEGYFIYPKGASRY